ncbi:hypothetical protein [Microbacterium sp. A1-JK]|uniref:hypothetical protein n=1 Tax=Microbacterium sp. A1-JK TaxID=3177516 RepID=UPI003883F66C
MAISSAGYEGTVDEPQWSDLLANGGGRQYAVADAASWKVTAGTADREVRIAVGRGYGYGVRDVSDTVVSLTLPAPSSGSRYDLIVAHRDWQANVTTFTRIAGSSARSIPTRVQTPGTIDDQPIALVRVTAGQTQVTEIVDLRVVNGSLAFDELVLQYLNRLGTKVRIGVTEWDRDVDSVGNPVWNRTDVTPDTGWVEATRNGGWAFQYCQFRRVGAVIFYRIAAERTQGWGAGDNLAIIPAGFAPDVATYVASSSSRGQGREFVFQTNGSVDTAIASSGATNVTLIGSYVAPR